MKLLLLSFCTIIIMWTATCVADPHKLSVVNNESIAKALYQRVLGLSPKDEDLDSDSKKRICHFITRSSYFSDILRERPLYVREIYQTFRNDVQKIPKIYTPPMEITANGQLAYTSRSTLVEVYINPSKKEFKLENAFVCLTTAIDGNIDHPKPYLVSGEYNLSGTPGSSKKARFLFDYIDPQDLTKVKVIAVAEEPADAFVLSPEVNVERTYLRRRSLNWPADNESDDPICQLDRHERLRLCALVLGSRNFATELKFVPDYRYVDSYRCTMREISFKKHHFTRTSSNVFSEWMIGCRPKDYYAEFQAEYFLSRVYDSRDTVFVYRRDPASQILVHDLYRDVRFKIPIQLPSV